MYRHTHRALTLTQGSFPQLGVLLRGPHNKACSISGSILGLHDFGKLPHIINPKPQTPNPEPQANFGRPWVALECIPRLPATYGFRGLGFRIIIGYVEPRPTTHYLGCSQNYGPFLVLNYTAAPSVLGVPKWEPNFKNYPFK